MKPVRQPYKNLPSHSSQHQTPVTPQNLLHKNTKTPCDLKLKSTKNIQVKRKLSNSNNYSSGSSKSHPLASTNLAPKREKTDKTTAKLPSISQHAKISIKTPTGLGRVTKTGRGYATCATSRSIQRMQPMSGLENIEPNREESIHADTPSIPSSSSSSSTPSQIDKEKIDLEKKVTELAIVVQSKQIEITSLKMEIGKLKDHQKSKSETILLEVETLHSENRLLRERLEELGLPITEAALSDSEKVILLQKKCNSAPSSLTGGHSSRLFCNSPLKSEAQCEGNASSGVAETEIEYIDGCIYPKSNNGGDVDHAASERGSLEWDKQSSSSLSEMSVACLHDRILQMEETHYSTSEELQATLQELSDLQDQLAELQVENERLNDDKSFILESLCKQTARLEDCRAQNDNLRQLLFQQSSSSSQPLETKTPVAETLTESTQLSFSDREQKLLELLKSVQEEKEMLLLKQDQLSAAVVMTKAEIGEQRREASFASEKARVAVAEAEAAKSEKRLLESKLNETKDTAAGEQAEVARLRTLLENERLKISEMQKNKQVTKNSDVENLLDIIKEERDQLQAANSLLQEKLTLSQNEVSQLREQVSTLQQESSIVSSNVKKQLSDADFKCQQMSAQKTLLEDEMLVIREALREMERQCEDQREDRRDLRTTISDLQKKLNEASGKAESLDRQLQELHQKHQTEAEEWNQFQNDLLMTVRVANDFKNEAQQDVENLLTENRQLKDKIRSMEAENDRLKAMKTTTSPPGQRRNMHTTETSVLSSVSPVLDPVAVDMATLRHVRSAARTAADNRLSVRSLIESIENASKHSKGNLISGNSISPPSSVIVSPVSEKHPLVPGILRRTDENLYSKVSGRPLSSDSSILREQNGSTCQPLRPLQQRNSYTEGVGNNKNAPVTSKSSPEKQYISPSKGLSTPESDTIKPISILTNKFDTTKRTSFGENGDKKDPLATLAKGGGSKRNALLKWCQNKTIGYRGIDITNFSSSWNDGLALCALLHTYIPEKIPYDELDSKDKKRNFSLAFKAAESVGISTILNINDMIAVERPDWQSVMSYVTSVYKHFET